MANNKTDTIRVGSFGDFQSNGREVPKNMVGKKIWYSPSRDLFAITDADNHNISQFGFEKFQQFVETGVIVYTNQGIQSHMEKLLKQKMKSLEGEDVNGDGYYDGYDQGYGDDYDNFEMPDDYYGDDDYDEYDEGYDDGYDNGYDDYDEPRGNGRGQRGPVLRRDSSVAYEGGMDSTAKKVKDPTRHMVGFMATTLILAIVVFILLNYAQPIVEMVSQLLS